MKHLALLIDLIVIVVRYEYLHWIGVTMCRPAVIGHTVYDKTLTFEGDFHRFLGLLQVFPCMFCTLVVTCLFIILIK